MEEFTLLYGAVGLGLITAFLPVILEGIKLLFKIDGDPMLRVSVVLTYLLVGLLIVSYWLEENPAPTASAIIMLILALIIYPVPIWFSTQGIYDKIVRPMRAGIVARREKRLQARKIR